jgi:hypothetical protein
VQRVNKIDVVMHMKFDKYWDPEEKEKTKPNHRRKKQGNCVQLCTCHCYVLGSKKERRLLLLLQGFYQ